MWWRRAAYVWMLLMLAETLHGMARTIFIAPTLGDLRARQLGIPVGCLIIFLITYFTVRWIGAKSATQHVVVGLGWAVLTLAFEFALGRTLGLTWTRIFADYNPARGGFMVLGLTFLLFAPLLAARIQTRRTAA